MINNILCILRNKAFNIVDVFQGSLVKSAYDEIKKIDNMDSTDNYIKEYHYNVFKRLAKHAIESTEFYRNIFSINLNDFPVINKNIIRNNQNMFLSKKYNKDRLITMSTSGSTGTPFICYQDFGKKRRVNAEVIYYSEKAGYSVGKNLIYLRAITDKNKKSKFHQWIQNETLIDISNLDYNKIKTIISKINKVSKNGSMILAYASTLDAFKDYFIENGFDIVKDANITGIISSSEMLYDETRDIIKKAFKTDVYSRYSNQENGIIGQDNEFSNVFIINEANYIVEIFKLNKDELCSEGEIGRIVVTDLYNYAMPMIRYDTGDIGSVTSIINNGKLKKVINNFSGRRVDIVYDSYGNRLSPHCITNNLWNFKEIKQFQFIQENKNDVSI